MLGEELGGEPRPRGQEVLAQCVSNCGWTWVEECSSIVFSEVFLGGV